MILAAIMASEHLERWGMHQSLFYEIAGGIFPFFLVSAGRASIARWPATTAALVYAGVIWTMLVLLPLFHGQPLLGPIYAHIDRFMPPEFPLLLFVPALGIDLAMRRVRGHDWRLSVVVGIVFVAAFLAAQWPFADFLMTPWARNWIFATHRLPYLADQAAQRRWYVLEPADTLRTGIPIAVVLACLSARLGLWWGNWMARVQR